MFRRDSESVLVGWLIVVGVIILVLYIMFLLATVVAGVALAGGSVYGGGYAIKNYVSSFKENVIDSNKSPAMAA